MDVLSKLFGSAARVKLMRLFLLNDKRAFTAKEIKSKSKVSLDTMRKELSRLKSADLIEQTTVIEEGKPLKNGKIPKKKVQGYQLNNDFVYLSALRTLVTNSASFSKEAIADRFSRVGRIKLVVLSGIFIDSDRGRIDVLVVGDSFRPGAFDAALKMLESEVGCELRYATFKTDDFLYRLGLYDKFIRDILDYPHDKIINKLTI